MERIWKFALNAMANTPIAMPRHAEIIACAKQGSDICIWARIHPATQIENRMFYVVGTGLGEIRPEDPHIGTVFDGPHVWHVFERKE